MPAWATTSKTMAYNALPAALSTSIHQHVYYTLPNNVTAPRGGAGFNQDYDNGRTPSPISGYPCCCYNFHMGWPKFAQNSWAGTDDGGLAVVAYAPNSVTANVGAAQGTPVTWTQTTNYPFDDTVTLTLQTPGNTRFPAQVARARLVRKRRNQNSTVRRNRKRKSRRAPGSRSTANGAMATPFTARFPMVPRVLLGVNNSVSVRRGPLIYSLKIDENWQVMNKGKVPGFDAYTVTPNSPWKLRPRADG